MDEARSMRGRIIATITACCVATAIACVAYQAGTLAGEDRVLNAVCHSAGQTWDRALLGCR